MEKERKYQKGQNSKIQKILDRIDHIETLLIRVTKILSKNDMATQAIKPTKALTKEEISFVGDSSDDEH
jgi:hypothetical protein